MNPSQSHAFRHQEVSKTHKPRVSNEPKQIKVTVVSPGLSSRRDTSNLSNQVAVLLSHCSIGCRWIKRLLGKVITSGYAKPWISNVDVCNKYNHPGTFWIWNWRFINKNDPKMVIKCYKLDVNCHYFKSQSCLLAFQAFIICFSPTQPLRLLHHLACPGPPSLDAEADVDASFSPSS